MRSELDPLGTEVGTGDPYVSYTSYQDIMGLDSLYEERGSVRPGGGCGTLDGLPISCSELRMRTQGGSVAVEFEVPETQPIPVLQPRGGGATTSTTVLARYRQPIVGQGIGIYMTLQPRFKGGLVPLDVNYEYDPWEEGLISLPQQRKPFRKPWLGFL